MLALKPRHICTEFSKLNLTPYQPPNRGGELSPHLDTPPHRTLTRNVTLKSLFIYFVA